jgi:hypothetical protein
MLKLNTDFTFVRNNNLIFQRKKLHADAFCGEIGSAKDMSFSLTDVTLD